MSRCKASHCPEEDLPEERAFCSLHWELLPASYRTWLCDAFGSLRWRQVLAECVRELRRIEGHAAQRRERA